MKARKRKRMKTMRKALPIGVDDFAKLRRNGYYYVDKTGLIKELLDIKGEVNQFTRPRRFGKTLNLSMLRYFFEDTGTEEGNRMNQELFEGLSVMDAGEYYTEQMGKYPVISLSLKSGKQPTWEMAWESITDEIIKEYNRHDDIRYSGKLLENELAQFEAIQQRTAGPLQFAKSLEFLSNCLTKSSGHHVILLVDEYDVPLENAYFNGFYPEMTNFVRSLFESALKTNPCLEFAVITGCLRITKKSIFTGPNNLKVVSILSDIYDEYFGFTQDEVEQMLLFYGRTEKRELLRQWYDGYRFGRAEVYNPWSVINIMDALQNNPDAMMVPYWSNTSSNDIVRSLIERADISVKGEIESLIEGGSVEKPVHEEITYDNIYDSEDNLWNFLFFTGYLKLLSKRQEAETVYITMAIPDSEVRYIYKNTVRSWFQKEMEGKDIGILVEALEKGDVKTMEAEISACLQETISFYDYAENYYHSFLSGLLKAQKKYRVISNRESGAGRPDILLKTASIKGAAVIFELKSVSEYDKMEEGCKAAVEQIKNRKYGEGPESEGYSKILQYGICFYKKECMVKKLDY